MQINILIYTKSGTTPIAQIFDAQNISWNMKINAVSTAQFSIPLYKVDGSIHEVLKTDGFLTKGNRVQIYVQEGSSEIMHFEGIIGDTEDQALSTSVLVVDFLGLLEQRIITANTSFVPSPIGNILGSILTGINSLDNTGVTLECSEPDTINLQWTGGTGMLSILNEVAEPGYQFMTVGRVLKFGKNIGVDRTVSGDDYFEFIYDYHDSRRNNISDFNFKSLGNNIQNDIYTNTGSSIANVFDAPSIAAHYRRQAFVSTKNNGELTKYLNEHKNNTSELTVTPSDIDLSAIRVGDKVQVYIDRGDARGKFSGPMQVMTKDTTFTSGKMQVVIGFSESSIKTPTVLDKIKQLDQDIQKIKIG